jgi:hypothetical protein
METEYEKICLYCEHAAPTYEAELMSCELKGIVKSCYKCRKFIYDPLKRIPRPPKKLGEEEMPQV